MTIGLIYIISDRRADSRAEHREGGGGDRERGRERERARERESGSRQSRTPDGHGTLWYNGTYKKQNDTYGIKVWVYT